MTKTAHTKLGLVQMCKWRSNQSTLYTHTHKKRPSGYQYNSMHNTLLIALKLYEWAKRTTVAVGASAVAVAAAATTIATLTVMEQNTLRYIVIAFDAISSADWWFEWYDCNSSGVYRRDYLHCEVLWCTKDAWMHMRLRFSWYMCSNMFCALNTEQCTLHTPLHQHINIWSRLWSFICCFIFVFIITLVALFLDVSSIICIICDAVDVCKYSGISTHIRSPDMLFLWFLHFSWGAFFCLM